MSHSIHHQIMVDSLRQELLWVIKWSSLLINNLLLLKVDSKIWIWSVAPQLLAVKYQDLLLMLLLLLTVVHQNQAPARSWLFSNKCPIRQVKWLKPTQSPPRQQTAVFNPLKLHKASITDSRVRLPLQTITCTKKLCLMAQAPPQWTRMEAAKVLVSWAKILLTLLNLARLTIRANSSSSYSISTLRLRRTDQGLSRLKDQLKDWATSLTMVHPCSLLIQMNNSSIALHHLMMLREVLPGQKK